jgi:flagellar operon protein
MNRINQYNPVLPPDLGNKTKPSQAKPDSKVIFKDVLQQQLTTDALVFSSHCQKRLEQNSIQLDQVQLDKLNSAVAKAADKGSRESCVIMDDKVFIVNVTSRTVKTIVDGQRMKENVFTNIDSAVIV